MSTSDDTPLAVDLTWFTDDEQYAEAAREYYARKYQR